ncbi:MAG: hypothetical protein HC836_13415 [Richelia sp. RM2_1_2]|nr:hypothetical protein [Richelia sp. SM1_7_0]NJN08742.1 hypothetical protein [Richelia sp. RM1_1_1]NJO27666.1 hypothetical protein [Richelia sp. SL_2_1]NJO59271.1 hypothetical protein [Richelia sp. RM2_1_2]
MNNLNINQPVNTQLVESLVQLIHSLSPAEQAVLQSKLFNDIPYPSTSELTNLIESSNTLDFLHKEPDIYTITDGEPI